MSDLEPILKSEQPLEFDAAAFQLELDKSGVKEKVRDNHRFFRLHNAKDGVLGARKHNPWGLSRRQWIEKFLKVRNKKNKVVPFILNPSQRRLEAEVLRMERAGFPVRVIILKARQQGFSTYVAALEWWYALTHAMARVAMITHRRQTTGVIFEKVRVFLRSMDKSETRRWEFSMLADSREGMTFDEPIYSAFIIDSAEADEPGRGDTFSVLHISELPSWKKGDQGKLVAILQALPSEPGTYGFNEATAKGDSNQFAKSFRRAWKNNRMGQKLVLGWRAVFFPWFFDQEYRWSNVMKEPLPDDVREQIVETLDEDERALLDMTYLRRGHGIVNVDIDQLAWRRYAITELCAANLDKFHEEYPATPDEAFVASGSRFFDQAAIKEMRERTVEKPVWRGELIDPEGDALLQRRLPDAEVIVGAVTNAEQDLVDLLD